MMRILFAVVCVVGLCSTSVEAGFQYGFDGITNNNATNTAIGEAQGVMAVYFKRRQVTFIFMNGSGGDNSSITDIYFDDNDLFEPSFAAIFSGSGTSFSQGASPNELPGGGSVGFETTPGLSLDSNSVENGIDPGEWVGVVMNLQTGKEIWDVTNDLVSQDLRIGVQMKGFDEGGSESFVNTPGIPVVPEPAAAALAGIACLGLLFCRKKKSNR